MRSNLARDKRGISPVITTVILVAVGIAIAVAIALWMSGLIGIFTRFEKIEIKNSYVEVDDSTFTVIVLFSNTGSSDTSVDSVLINGRPFDAWTNPNVSVNGSQTLSPFAVPVGKQMRLEITIPSGASSGGATLRSGVTVTVTLHSTGGREYPTSVTLP